MWHCTYCTFRKIHAPNAKKLKKNAGSKLWQSAMDRVAGKISAREKRRRSGTRPTLAQRETEPPPINHKIIIIISQRDARLSKTTAPLRTMRPYRPRLREIALLPATHRIAVLQTPIRPSSPSVQWTRKGAHGDGVRPFQSPAQPTPARRTDLHPEVPMVVGQPTSSSTVGLTGSGNETERDIGEPRQRVPGAGRRLDLKRGTT